MRRGTVSLGLTVPMIDGQPISVSVRFMASLLIEITTGQPLALRALPGYAIPTVSKKGSQCQRRDGHVSLHRQNG
jgi:hypothetical protein